MIQNVLISIAISALSIVIGYTLFFFNKLTFFKSTTTAFNKPISIIICAKNELENLRENLPIIFNQNFQKFEVIVVNDQSNDRSDILLKELEKKYKHLVVVTIEQHINKHIGKKFALTLGIKTAKYEHLLLTDADCFPNSKNWAQLMCNNFNTADIVLGYGGYQKKKGLLNKIIRFDTFNVAQQYLSYALVGHTYMGVGRNMAYKKSLFFDNKGFANHIHIPSGDDDLFIQEIATKNNVTIEIEEQAHTSSEVIKNWKEWSYQKRRHLTTAPLYKTKFKVLLALYPYAQFLFWLAIILLFILKISITIITILLGVKLLMSYLVNYKSMKKLNVIDLYWIHPIYEVLHLFIQGIFVLLNLVSKPKKWSK
ncbi:MAG TPA: glycosyltransferase [Flavobacteriales bacterium]|nr:glycosyltransferase [Flavobacteriales bacterium]